MKFKVEKTNNGYRVDIVGSQKHDGPWEFKFTEEEKLLEMLGLLLMDGKVEVRRK